MVLLLSCGALAVALLLRVGPDQRVAVWGLADWPLPATCASRTVFDVDCPGCGLTRSIIHLAHGQWQAAWQMHRVGWLVAAGVVLQVPYRVFRLRRPGPHPRFDRLAPRLVCGLILLLVANWLYNVCS